MTEYEQLCSQAGQAVADRALALGYIDPPEVTQVQSRLDLFEDQERQTIIESLESFRFQGKKTIIEDRDGVPFFINEFWTARQRQAHSIQEVSYRACFKPQLPEFFISRLTQPGAAVYDPFMGRGTTPIQAVLMGRRAFGNDVNPLSVYLTRPRINPPLLSDIQKRLAEIDWFYPVETETDLLTFYHPDTLREILNLRSYLLERQAAGQLDRVDDWIRMVAVNRLTGHSTGFFSVYSLPPNQAVSIEAQRRINAKRDQVPPRRIVPDIIYKKSASLLKDGSPPPGGEGLFTVSSAENSPGIPTSSVQLVVTSPPFLDVVQYAADNWLRCWFVGIDPKDIAIAMHKKVEDWTNFIAQTFTELGRIVSPGGHVAFEVGEVRNGKVKLEELVLTAINKNYFETIGVVVNAQDFTKTANCWGVDNNSKGTNTNRIVLARRR
ncbi:MAG: DNA methyltransferase [Caulobacteraceae bacterium]